MSEETVPEGRVGAWVLGLLIAAGTIKASPLTAALPFDFTAACAGVIGLICVHTVLGAVKGRASLPRVMGPALAALGLGFYGIVNAPHTTYAAQKTTALLTLTVGAAFIGALILVRSERQRIALAYATVAVGLLVVVLIHFAPATEANLLGRLAAEGSSTIAGPRYAGAGLVATLALAAGGRLRLLYAVVLAAGPVTVLVQAGSRGPLVAAGLTSIVILVLLPSVRYRLRAIAAAAVVLVLVARSWANTGTTARGRVLALLANDKGDSVYQREHMWHVGWGEFLAHPFGLGWGGLEAPLFPIDRYPHNVVIEVAGEGGVLVLAALVVALGVAYLRAGRAAHRGDISALCMVTLMTFWLVNALVSGDLNDNRGLFVFLAACLMTRAVGGLGDEPEAEELGPQVVDEGQRGREVGSGSRRG